MTTERRRQTDDVADRAEQSDRDAVARVLQGDRDAFALIVRRYHSGLYRLAWRLVGSSAVAEELTQEAFARAFTHLGSFRNDSSLRPWLFRILANLCKDVTKSASRRERPSEDPTAGGHLPALAEAGAPSAESRLDQRRALDRLSEAIRALPDGQREAFVLRIVENQSYEEVSAILEVPVGALKVRVHRARERLKTSLGPLLDSILPEEAA